MQLDLNAAAPTLLRSLFLLVPTTFGEEQTNMNSAAGSGQVSGILRTERSVSEVLPNFRKKRENQYREGMPIDTGARSRGTLPYCALPGKYPQRMWWHRMKKHSRWAVSTVMTLCPLSHSGLHILK